GAGASGVPAVADAVGSEAGGIGRCGRLFRASGGVSGLCEAVGVGPVDWQWVGGRSVQTGDWPTHEADGGALARAAGESDGNAVLHVPWGYLEALLGTAT